MIRLAASHAAMATLVAGEAVAAVSGFLATLRLARQLGPGGLGSVEFAVAAAAWWMILVRGGFDALIVREAAQHPDSMHALSRVHRLGRLACALPGWLAVIACGLVSGNLATCACAGMLLCIAAATPDLSARASGDLRTIAIAAAARGMISLCWILIFIGPDAPPWMAVLGLVTGELTSTLVFQIFGAHAPPISQMRGISPDALLRRGRSSLAASVWRFSRVTLYALDILLLGCCADAEFGYYAGARRLAFALLGLSLILPAASAGSLAAAFASDRKRAQTRVDQLVHAILWVTLPATVGLTLTADGWMPLLYGSHFGGTGHWLKLLVWRVPILAVSSALQSALFADGRERTLAWQSTVLVLVAILLEYVAWRSSGVLAVGWAALVVEGVGLLWSSVLLMRRGLALTWAIPPRELISALVGLVLGCLSVPHGFTVMATFAGASGFAAGFAIGKAFKLARHPSTPRFSRSHQ